MRPELRLALALAVGLALTIATDRGPYAATLGALGAAWCVLELTGHKRPPR